MSLISALSMIVVTPEHLYITSASLHPSNNLTLQQTPQNNLELYISTWTTE